MGVARLIVREFVTSAGQSPFREWLSTLDTSTRARVQARILRFESGNLGDHRSVGRGVYEARLPFGPGYRVYFGRVGNRLMLLLLGGDKGSQRRDIEKAQRYWRFFLEADDDGETK